MFLGLRQICLLLCSFALTGFPVTVLANSLQEAEEAFWRGDRETGVQILKPLAAAGDPEAQYQLWRRYSEEDRDAWGQKAGLAWLRKAAEQGLAQAQFDLGIAYQHGNGSGVPEDHYQAAFWFEKAANQGHSYGQLYLGHAYADGEGVSQDNGKAAFWYRKSAEQGEPPAQWHLARAYAHGLGVQQSYREAVKWYRRSAEQGWVFSQIALGRAYEEGSGVIQDYREAVTWYRRAAERGAPIALHYLGLMFANGHGLSPNHIYAHMLFNLAASRGIEDAATQREVMARQMNREQIERAQTLAREWRVDSPLP